MKLLRIHRWPLYFLLSLSVLLSSCEEIANEVLGEAIDCIFPHKPELTARIQAGEVEEPYSGLITASVKNSPDEASFDYAFDLMGSLPEGIQYTIFDRNIRFSGKPLESGSFRFQVTVAVIDTREDADDGSCLGNNSISEDYVMHIQP